MEKRGVGLKEWRENASEEEKARAIEKSRETRAKNKKMRDVAKTLLDMPVGSKFALKQGLMDAKMTVQEVMLWSQIRKAVEDEDTSAFIAVRDTSGNKPKDEIEVEGSLSIEKLLKEVSDEDEY